MSKKHNLDKEMLREMYIDQDLTAEEIGERLGISGWTIYSILRRFEITKPRSKQYHKIEFDANELRQLFIDECKSEDEIAKIKGVSPATISKNLIRFGIQREPIERDYLSCEDLAKAFIDEGRSESEIAELFGVDKSCVKYWRRKYDIRRDKKVLPGFETLMRMSLEDEKSHRQIAEELGVSKSLISKRFMDAGVQTPKELIRKKVESTCVEKYGAPNFNQQHLSQDSIDATSCRESLLKFISDHKITTETELANALGYSYGRIGIIIRDFDLYDALNHSESSPEQEVRDFILSLGIKCERTRELLDGKEIDIYCPEQRVGIEFNGIYWHSSLWKQRNYHFDKSKNAEAAGIRLIHIYENEWKDQRTRPIIESIIRLALGLIPNRIYARQCEVREISNATARDFVNANHMQGHRSARITLGLFYHDELVQLMSFSHNKDYEWEIIRSCPKMNLSVVGGISKLFKYFVKTYAPNEVFSYADFNKFDGNGYASLGMEFIGYTGPDMKWIVGGQVLNRNPGKNAELRAIADAQLFGAGSKKYLWRNNLLKGE